MGQSSSSLDTDTEARHKESVADDDDPMIMISEVKTAEEIIREKVNKAKAEGCIIKVDSDECRDGASDQKEENEGNDTMMDEDQKRIIALERLEAAGATNSVIEINDEDDGRNDAVGQNEGINELTENDMEGISSRLTQLYAAEAAASLNLSSLCTVCNVKRRKSNCVVICTECPKRFHLSCLEHHYHIVWEDLNNARFVCPICKGVKVERYDSDDDSEYSCEGC